MIFQRRTTQHWTAKTSLSELGRKSRFTHLLKIKWTYQKSWFVQHRCCVKLMSPYPGPRGFSWFFSSWESRERAAKRRTRVAKRRERKTSGYLGLESHFHADARVRIWPSASDWLIFLKTRKSIWLVSLIGNTEGTVGISATTLLVVGNKFGWFQWGFLSTFPGGKHSRKHAFK